MSFKSTSLGVLRWIWRFRSLIIVITFPILLSPILIIYDTPAAKGAYALLLISGYWVTEAMSIYVTALLPIALGPLMGIAKTDQICQLYMKDAIMLFLGGAFIAISIEEAAGHLRVGLFVLNIIPKTKAMILLGFMSTTFFLSMWISNAAATMMILTISDALMKKIINSVPGEDSEDNIFDSDDEDIEKSSGKKDTLNMDEVIISQPGKPNQNQSEDLKSLGAAVSLGIPFASSVGGIGTVIGTPTNVVLAGVIKEKFPHLSVDFATWMLYAFPLSLICLLLTWVILCIFFFGFREFFSCKCGKSEQTNRINNIIKKEKANLGPIRWAEVVCLIVLSVTILLWISREPGVPGWSRFVNVDNKKYVSDTQVAILAAVFLMVVPRKNPFSRSGPDGPSADATAVLLPWSVAAKKTPWAVVIIIGGGFAIAKITEDSGFSKIIGIQLRVIEHWPAAALVSIFTIFGAIATTFIANSAAFTLLSTIAFEMCKSSNLHPFYLNYPLAVGCSLAFPLPVSTPANAIAYDKGGLELKDMMKTGTLTCITCVIVTILCTISYAVPLFDFNTPYLYDKAYTTLAPPNSTVA